MNRRPMVLCVTANGQSAESGAETTGSGPHVQVCLFYSHKTEKEHKFTKYLDPENTSFLLYVVQLDSNAILDCYIIGNDIAQCRDNVAQLLLWTT